MYALPGAVGVEGRTERAERTESIEARVCLGASEANTPSVENVDGI